ncbi:MAG: hypothetical protein AAGH79_03710 [Bacteroidota bacterium]
MRFWYSTALLGLLVLPFLSSYTWLQVQKKQARRAVKALVKQDLPISTLTHLVFSTETTRNQLQWIHEHEFRYQGILYDIFLQEACEDETHYWVWPDHEETQLQQELRNWLAQQAQLPIDQQASGLQFGKHWLCDVTELQVLTPPLHKASARFTYQSASSQFVRAPILAPPECTDSHI